MINLYNSVCHQCSEVVTKNYSTSFSLGIRMFSKEFRKPIYSIYGFVRFADEIVDTFYNCDQEQVLNRFREDTFKAIDEKFSINPVLHAFQDVVNEYNIDHKLISAFLDSMEMDLHLTEHTCESYKEYIYGSAEVVGLMCLKVFLKDNPDDYERLIPNASALGSAFQKVNFLRDIKSDFQDRKRVYFPNVDFENFNKCEKEQIENDIQREFDFAYKGIIQLPRGVRFGVYTAYIYYVNLFNKIKNAPKETILSQRVRISNPQKLYLLTKSAVRNQFNFF